MKIDANARYTRTHEWVRQEGGLWTYGISDHAQESLSDIVYVELPAVGDAFKAGDALGALESVKAASDLLMPVAGAVQAVNEDLPASPDVINSDPFGQGWLLKLQPENAADWETLLSPADYEAFCQAEKEAERLSDLLPRLDGDTACLIVQNTTLFGDLLPDDGLAEKVHAAGALLVVVTVPVISLGLMRRAPHNTPVSRLDEVRAARNPVLCYKG